MNDFEIGETLKFISRGGELDYLGFKDEIGNDFLYTLVTNKKFFLALAMLKDLGRYRYEGSKARVLRRVNKDRETEVKETLPLTAFKNGDRELRVIRFYIDFIDEILKEEYDQLIDAINGKRVEFDFKFYYRMELLSIMDHIQKYIKDFKTIAVSTGDYNLIKAFLNTDELKDELNSELKYVVTSNIRVFTKVLEDGLLENLLDLYDDEKELLKTDSLYQQKANSCSLDLDFYKLLVDKITESERFKKTYLDDDNKEYTPLNIVIDKSVVLPEVFLPLVQYIVSNDKIDVSVIQKTLAYLFSNHNEFTAKDVYNVLSQFDTIDWFLKSFNDEIVGLLISKSIKNIGVDASKSMHYEKVMKLIIKRMIDELYVKFDKRDSSVDTMSIVNKYSEVFGNKELADNIYADFLDNLFLKIKNNPSMNLDEISQMLFDKYCKDKNKIYYKYFR